LANDRVLQLTDSLDVAPGSPLIDVAGKLAGIWTGGAMAIPSTQATPILGSARTNVAQNRLLTPNAVSVQERYAYGSVLVSSDVPATSVDVSPLEAWQSASLQSSGNAPLLFAGPMGRYRVVVSAPGSVRREQEVTIQPGVQNKLIIQLHTVAVLPTTQPAAKKSGSKLPWVLAAVGGTGVAAAFALMGGGGSKGDSGGGVQQPPPPTTGTITFKVPVNP